MARLVVEMLLQVKPPLRTLLLVASGIPLLALLAWTGTYLYWHVRILGAIRTLEDPTNPKEYQGARAFLGSAGCRALPYVMDSLDPEKNQPWIWECLYGISVSSVTTGGAPAKLKQETWAALYYLEECYVDPIITLPKRRERAARIRTLWKESGADFHMWWRIWSSNCGSR